MKTDVLDVLRRHNTILEKGHFVYVSGKHGATYIVKEELQPLLVILTHLGREMAELFKDDGIETVVGPAVGGALLAQWVAYGLQTIQGRNVCSVYTEHLNGEVQLRHPFHKYVTGKRILAIDDVINTGGSLAGAAQAAVNIGGDLVGLGSMVMRGPATNLASCEEIAGGLKSLVTMDLPIWTEEECTRTGPCSRNVPVNTDFGHGREFLARQKL